MSKKKALITGGSGYLGENLVKELIKKNYECTILDIHSPTQPILKEVKFLKSDIRDLENVIQAAKDQDIIFHNVAQVPLAKNKSLFGSVNVRGTQNILEASNLSGCDRLIFMSSSAVYGVPKSNPITIDSITSPFEDYGKSKLQAEEVLNLNDTSLNITIIRPRTILGNGRLGIFQILFEWVYSNKNIPVFDGGDNIYQFIHSDDLVKATILCAEKEVNGILNIGSQSYGTMKESLESLIDYAGSKSKIVSLPSRFIKPLMNLSSALNLSPLGSYHADMYGKSIFFDIEREKEILNWEPNFSNNEMIIDSYKWYLNNREAILQNNNKYSAHKSKVKKGLLNLFEKII